MGPKFLVAAREYLEFRDGMMRSSSRHGSTAAHEKCGRAGVRQDFMQISDNTEALIYEFD
jgi:hypothetical protein